MRLLEESRSLLTLAPIPDETLKPFAWYLCARQLAQALSE